ncbi:hypothetical protein Prudu_336S000100 [Prunus dulcis]|uniref:Uncharacterized protein n=1 Tax=Prunus dulcis TaxID=3755 RepID=A0A5H2XPE1_PRUDU|nr:hypothetical protein Prudu_336S000100 [Prunus dulcis]
MDEAEFRRLLDLFPIVRSRGYHAELEQSKESTSKSAQYEEVKEWQDAWDEGDKKEVEKQGLDQHGAFWEKLKLVAERKAVLLEFVVVSVLVGWPTRQWNVDPVRKFQNDRQGGIINISAPWVLFRYSRRKLSWMVMNVSATCDRKFGDTSTKTTTYDMYPSTTQPAGAHPRPRTTIMNLYNHQHCNPVQVGEAEAERFCKAFQQIHKKLVYEELSLDAAQKFLNSS